MNPQPKKQCELYNQCGDPTSKTCKQGPQINHDTIYCGRFRRYKNEK